MFFFVYVVELSVRKLLLMLNNSFTKKKQYIVLFKKYIYTLSHNLRTAVTK